MEVNQIFEDINFKIGPDSNYRKAYLYRIIKGFYKIFGNSKKYDFSNCLIKKKSEDIELKKVLIKIDSMSTYAIGHVINKICKNLNEHQIYLNVGVWKGFSLLAGMINTKCEVIGIDNFSQFGGPKNLFLKKFNRYKRINHFFYDIDYQEFFKNFEKKSKFIDFYFYDGEHSYENQIKNLLIVDQFLKKESLILIDDINFQEVYDGTMDFMNKSSSNFSIIKSIKTKNNHCHPSYWNGIMIIKKN